MTTEITVGDRISMAVGGFHKLGESAPETGTEIADEYKVFLREFGEEITYRPKDGLNRTILAVVDRDPPAPVEGAGEGVMGKRIVIWVANNESSIAIDEFGGIAVDELNTGGDEVDLPVRLGKTAETRQLGQLLEQDGGMLSIEVR